MYLLTAQEQKSIESAFLQKTHMNSIELMEKAAIAITEEIKAKWPSSFPVKVFAGPHNNGGDALAVSRILTLAGYDVEVFLFNVKGSLSPDCQTNRDRLVEQCPNVVFHEIDQKVDLPRLTEQTLVIDGLFGIGLNRPLSSSFIQLVKFINKSPSTVISIDIPSGMMSEDNTSTSQHAIIEADYTFSIHACKPAFLLTDCQQYIGHCKVLDIGLPAVIDKTIEYQYHLNQEDDIRTLLRTRDPFGNKGTFGHGLLVAGTYGMAGAAVIAAKSAMRSGVGKITLHTPATNNIIVQTTVPEAIIHNDADNFTFTTYEPDEEFDAVAIGPGLGKKKETETAFFKQLAQTTKPLVIDADGLNILSGHNAWYHYVPIMSILTPHPKEFARLCGESHFSSDYVMLDTARTMARNLRLFIVLKGHYTAICTPSDKVYFNTTGNSGMATAGTGDALTGILLSLLAQGYTPEEACRLGCYLHGLAGDIAANQMTEEGMTVMDLINALPSAIKKLKKINN